jgi:hypothetical protein
VSVLDIIGIAKLESNAQWLFHLCPGQVIKGWDHGIKIIEQKMLFLPFLRRAVDLVHLQLFH